MIQNQTVDQFQAKLDVHVTPSFRILRAAAELIRVVDKREADEGRAVIRKVVNISSIGGFSGNAGQVNYCSGKSALIGMIKTTAKEWVAIRGA